MNCRCTRCESDWDGLPTAAQVACLGPLGRTAIHTGVLDAAGGAELVRLLLDLHRQLPGGRQDEHDGTVARFCGRATWRKLS